MVKSRAVLTNTATVVIAIITVCATLPVVAAIKTVSYSASLYSNVLMVVVFALTVGHHSNHFIEFAFDTAALCHMDLGIGRPNFNPSCTDWLTLVYWARGCGMPGPLSPALSKRASLVDAPSLRSFCIFGAASSGMNGHAAWFENIDATEFVNADYYLHEIVKNLGEFLEAGLKIVLSDSNPATAFSFGQLQFVINKAIR
ncbi:IGHMBP2, partial [Symbiodinium necroappetens]